MFFIRQKLSKTNAAQIRNIMQSSSTLIRISGPIPEKKIGLDQWLGKYCILGRNRGKRGVAKEVCFVSNTVEGSEKVTMQGKIFSTFQHQN